MGCFNMMCAVTGVPILHDQKVVRFRIGQREYGRWTFTGDNYFICGLPEFGVYDDYGGLELTENNEDWLVVNRYVEAQGIEMKMLQPCDPSHNRDWEYARYPDNETLFMLREVYDEIVSRDPDAAKSWSQVHETYRDERLAAIAEVDERVQDLIDRYKDKKDHGSQMIYDMARSTVHRGQLWRMYHVQEEVTHLWNDLIMENSDIGEVYYETVGRVLHSTHRHGWEIAPSLYAGQDTMWDEVLKMREIGTDYVRRMKKEYDSWDEDFEELE